MSEQEEFDELLRVKPDVLQTLLLFKMYKTLRRMEKRNHKLDAVGVVRPIEPITVTDSVEGRRVMALAGYPWFCVEITNDGPDDCWVIVNTEKNVDPHLVRVEETYKVNMKRAIIKDVLMRCDEGKTAMVRLVGSK